MKLNLAHGTHPTGLPGWLNVDLPWDGVRGADVYADAFSLPFRDAAFEAAYVGHFLEHVEWDLIPAVLAELRRVLMVPALVMFVGPDIDRARAQGEPQLILDAITSLGGGPGGHKWVATEALTAEAVERGGFSAVPWPVAAVTSPDWPNPTTAAWQCAVLGVYRASIVPCSPSTRK